MKTENKLPGLRMLMLVAASKTARKASVLFREGNLPIYYQLHGKGTASSEIMDILGLGTVDKTILLGIMPKPFADRMLQIMKKELKLNMPNTGIAFSLIMSGGSGRVINKLNRLNEEGMQTGEERSRREMPETSYTMIMVIANQGYSGEIMDAARSVGAAGGTVIHARQAVNEETVKFWGISIQPEREITIILAQKDDKLAIMQAISEKCGRQSDARSIVFSLPVDQVVGID